MATFTIEEVNAIRKEEREATLQSIRDAVVNAKNTKGWDQMPVDLHKAIDKLFIAAGA
jgi:hypothetical protein